MKEIFTLSYASFPVGGTIPVRITASSVTSSDEVTTTSVIFSRYPNGEFKEIHQTEIMSGLLKFNEEKKHLLTKLNPNWTETRADAVAEMVTYKWMFDMNDQFWNTYLRSQGPLTWQEQEDPEVKLLRFALGGNDHTINLLESVSKVLVQPQAKKAFEQSIEAARLFNFRTP